MYILIVLYTVWQVGGIDRPVLSKVTSVENYLISGKGHENIQATYTVTKVSAFSVLLHGVPQGTRPLARNFPRFKIRAIAGYSTDPPTITSYS